jgi:fructose-bisphosphate aldolase, class I
MNAEQFAQMKDAPGFIAALDQSGGSTPHALDLYGIGPQAYKTEAEMFDLMHDMRRRIITSPAFTRARIIGSILFEQTLDRQIEGQGSAEFLWQVKHVVPFVKVDKGLADVADGVRLMKPIPDLDSLLERALSHQVFGTKMRSVISLANADGINAIVAQQFALARQIMAAGLVPIIEPEIDIHSPEKTDAELLLRLALRDALDSLDDGQYVMLKLTLPDVSDFYAELVAHPRIVRVAALSGGYARLEANFRLAHNHGVIASFSRALTQGLNVRQSQEEFDQVLDDSISSIYTASTVKETDYVM